jgi:hypothetical protein
LTKMRATDLVLDALERVEHAEPLAQKGASRTKTSLCA